MFIIVIKGTNVGTVYSLSKTDFTVIGRDENCDICVLDPLISRRHCQIEWKNNSFYLKDLNSTNKTLLNKKPVEELEKLEPGDTIKVGDTILLFTDKEEVPIRRIEEYQILRMSKTQTDCGQTPIDLDK